MEEGGGMGVRGGVGVGGDVPLISFIIFVDHVLLQYSIQALCNI